MNTEAMLTTSWYQFAQEDHFITHLFYGNIVVLNAREATLHLIQLMIVRSEKGLRLGIRMLMDILHDSPCDRDTVVSAGTSSQLIEKHQTTSGHVIENIRCLIHFHHKGGFTHRNVI